VERPLAALFVEPHQRFLIDGMIGNTGRQLGGRLLFRGHGLESITPGRTDPAESAMVKKSEIVAKTVANKRPFIGNSMDSRGVWWKPSLTSIPVESA
jgi:hypothetical protein